MPNPYGRPQNGFLEDYSGIANAGSAFKGFVQGMQGAQEQNLKKQEIEAKMKAFQVDQDRKSQETAIKNKMANISAEKGGYHFDEQGNLVLDQGSLAVQKQKTQEDLAKKRMDNQDQRLGLQKSKFEEQQSQNAAQAGKTMQDDSLIKEFQQAKSNLARGKSLLTGETPLTYNNLNAVQQDIISALSKGGQSSEGKVSREMQESYKGRWNNLMAKMGQYGPDNDVRKQDPGLAKQVGQLLDEVDSAISKNIVERNKKLGSIYSQHSNKKVQATVQKQLEDANQGVVPTGMVKPGMVSGPAAAPQAPPHPEDSAAVQWAKANPQDPRAAAILKANGL